MLLSTLLVTLSISFDGDNCCSIANCKLVFNQTVLVVVAVVVVVGEHLNPADGPTD